MATEIRDDDPFKELRQRASVEDPRLSQALFLFFSQTEQAAIVLLITL